MPQLPTIQPRPLRRAASPLAEADAIARIFAHRAAQNDIQHLGGAVKRWLLSDPEAKSAFIKWYEEQP